MRKLVVSQFVTLDGVAEDPGGSEKMPGGGWAFAYDRGPDGDKFKFDEVMASDALLLRRKTYEGFAAAWPSRTDEAGFANKFNGMAKYVVSSTLRDPSWNNSTVLGSDLVKEVGRLKAEGDGDLLVNGSLQLCRALFDGGLVDELRLMVFPVAIGSGRKLFADGAAPSHFRLVEAKRASEVAILTLQPK